VVEPIRRVAVIFNSTEHAGSAVAKRLAAGGADLVVHEPSDELLSALGASGRDVLPVTADLGSRRGHDVLVDATLERFGRLDAAWIRSGVTVGVYGQFSQSSDELWETVKLHNLDMVRWALQAVLPPMVNAGTGQVLVSTSATGLRPEPGASLYAATRAGAIALVRAVGLEYATTGVTVNAIATNFLDVASFVSAVRATEPARRRAVEQSSPMHRLGTAEELAEFAAVLLEGRSRFQTGQCFSFSGGWTR
jgi:NAD(P)-dependent dehydrogenase (short-subunit alcohol dehydrogenase family)